MLTQLRAIFDLIVQFENAQSNLYAAAEEEVRNRQQLRNAVNKKTDKVNQQAVLYYIPQSLFPSIHPSIRSSTYLLFCSFIMNTSTHCFLFYPSIYLFILFMCLFIFSSIHSFIYIFVLLIHL